MFKNSQIYKPPKMHIITDKYDINTLMIEAII